MHLNDPTRTPAQLRARMTETPAGQPPTVATSLPKTSQRQGEAGRDSRVSGPSNPTLFELEAALRRLHRTHRTLTETETRTLCRLLDVNRERVLVA